MTELNDLIEDIEEQGCVYSLNIESIEDLSEISRAFKKYNKNREAVIYTPVKSYVTIKNILENENAHYASGSETGTFKTNKKGPLRFLIDYSFYLEGVTFHVVPKFNIPGSVVLGTDENEFSPRNCILIKDFN